MSRTSHGGGWCQRLLRPQLAFCSPITYVRLLHCRKDFQHTFAVAGERWAGDAGAGQKPSCPLQVRVPAVKCRKSSRSFLSRDVPSPPAGSAQGSPGAGWKDPQVQEHRAQGPGSQVDCQVLGHWGDIQGRASSQLGAGELASGEARGSP